jgi:hypothetical protein
LTDIAALKKFWPPSPVVIAILKCAISYLIASLFTFVPALANTLSVQSEIDAHGRVTPKPAYSAHMVATIVVYVSRFETDISQEQPLTMTNPVQSRENSRQHVSSVPLLRYPRSFRHHHLAPGHGDGASI